MLQHAILAALMAPRKKSSSKQPNVGAWLGGNKGYVLSGSNTDTSAKVDSGGGQMEAVRAELGLGAYAAGVGAAGAIGAGVAAARSGVAARVGNKFRGEVVGLHGSPVKGLKQIEPRVGTYAPENAKPLAYAANPKFPQAIREVEDYAMGYSAPVRPTDRGSIYVTKAKKSAVVKPESGAPISSSPIFASQQPMKVVAEVSMYDLNRNQNLTKILKRAGAKVPKKK